MSVATLNRKDQITQTAQNLFAEKGYAATSMRDLAKAVGIEAASLYSHVGSKEELLRDICFGIANEFFGATDFDETTNPLHRLELMIAGHVQVIIDHLDASGVFYKEWRHLGEPYLTEFKVMRDRYEAQFRGIIEYGIELGYFKSGNPKLMTKLVLGTLNSIHEWYRPDGATDPEKLSRDMSRYILQGIVKA